MPRHREHHLHLPLFTIDTSRNLTLLYGIRLVRDLVNKTALFFLPIFLYQFGAATNYLPWWALSDFQRGMVTIGLYYILFRGIAMAMSIPSARLLNAIGYHRIFILSYLGRLITFACFFLVSYNPWFLLAATLINGIQTSLFWNAYYTILSKTTLKEHMGSDLGVLQVLLQVVGAVAPALSGAIAVFAGFEVLFLIGLIGSIISMIFTLLMETDDAEVQASLREFVAWMREKEFGQLATSYIGRYINDAVLFLWPLYVFFLLDSIDKVGYLYTVSLFLALLISFFGGSYIDKLRSRKPFFFSGGLLSVVWVARTQVISVWAIALVDMVDKLTANFHWLFFDTIFMRRGKGSRAFAYFVYREMILGIAAILFWTVFILFFLFNVGWQPLFIFASVGVLLSLLIKDRTISA